MFRTAFQLLLVTFLGTSAATAGRHIELLSGDPNDVSISDYYGRIQITDGDPNSFVFWCYDPDDPNYPPADIESITLLGTPSGTVKIEVLPGPGYTYGAANVKQINLNATGVTGIIGQMFISGDLAEDGPVLASSLVGPVQVTGEILDDITIGALSGDISCANMGNIYMDGVSGDPAPSITIEGAYDHHLWINASKTTGTIGSLHLGALGSNGEIELITVEDLDIQHECLGKIDIWQDLVLAVFWQGMNGMIHVYGDVGNMYCLDESSGDIIVDGDLTLVTHDGNYGHGDISGNLEVGGISRIEIGGTLQDSGNNHVRLGQVEFFGCWRMKLAADRERWLTFESETGYIGGNFYIEFLCGVLRFKDVFAGRLYISGIVAPPTNDPDMPYGGVYFEQGTNQYSTITIGTLCSGWIFADNADIAEGVLTITDLGSTIWPGVARVLTGHATTPESKPTDFGWDMSIEHNLLPSADRQPAIYTSGDLMGSIEVGTNESNPGAMMPGAAIQIDGDVAGWAFMEFNDEPMAGDIEIGGNLYGDLIMNDVSMSGNVYLDGDLNGSIGCAGMTSDGYIRVSGDVGWNGYIGVGPQPYSGLINVIEDFNGLMMINNNGSYIDGLTYIGGSLRNY
jgi:formylmethanofuran dehydrogenase subunit C